MTTAPALLHWTVPPLVWYIDTAQCTQAWQALHSPGMAGSYVIDYVPHADGRNRLAWWFQGRGASSPEQFNPCESPEQGRAEAEADHRLRFSRRVSGLTRHPVKVSP